MLYLIPFLFISTQLHAWNLFSPPPPKAQIQTPQASIFEGEPPKCLSKRQQFEQNLYRCPEPSELKKVGLKWQSGTTWRGYQDSFAQEISKFLGAQWKGVGVGRAVCLYETNDTSDFPVQISSQSLIERPSLPRWENNPSASIINCISRNGSTCECPFSYYIEDEQDLDDVIKSLEK